MFLSGTTCRTTALLAALAAAFAQAPAQPDEAVIRITVNLVQVDAVVTDSKDQPVTDLKAEDFEIRQDGKVQKITNFSYITTRPATAAATLPARRPSPVKGVPPPPPAVLKPADIRRTVALVVDDLGLSFESIVRIRETLKKFVDQEMQPGDLVAIIRTGAGMGALQQFTADKRMLHAAIDRVKYNGIGRVGISSFAPLGSEPAMGSPAATESRNEIFTVGSLGAIRYVVEGLRELPGRKSVILFSENIQLFDADGMNQLVMDSVRHLTDAANRSSVVIYTIDPRGLQYYGLTAADNTSGMTQQQVTELPGRRSQEVLRSQDGMVMLASETGGLFLHDNNDLNGQVRQIMADSEGYYLIGYHPDASTFDARTGEAKFHKVSVRVKRPGVRVRSRSGFFGASDRERQQVAHTREAEIAHALVSPFSSGDIHVRLTPLFSSSPEVGSFLNTLLYIDTRDLKFTEEPDGREKAVIDLVAITFGDNGQPVDSTDKTYTIRAPKDTYEAALKDGLLYAVSHPVKKSGAYQMRVVVRDATSEEVGSASQFIKVPDVSKGRLTLSSIVLKERPPDGATPGLDHGEGQITEPNPQGSAAVRIFKPGTAIMYGYQVLNAQTGAQQHPSLEVQTRLYRDGKEVYTGKAMTLSMEGQPDPKRLIGGGSMKLGAQITPGDYVLQVIVTDKLASEKYRTATQWMDFEIQ
ncbi:conserved exported hypothetical protein [Candidatus Sulfopaludibacter sp. SbA4]|nr:conserved exported hypothetical protein [Candidatus Sulfopaludibacter sp. SbA4]